MSKKLKNDLTLEIVDLPVPILKHPRWLTVNYPKKINEDALLTILRQSFPEIECFAKNKKLGQIKIAVNPSWRNLNKLGLAPAVHYVTNNSQALSKLQPNNFQIIELENPQKIKDLIKKQFLYHHEYKPAYFTHNIVKSVEWFLKLAKQNIKSQEGFLLAGKRKGRLIGLLYGEIYEREGCIDELFVEEKFRNQGLGKTLLKKAGEKFQKIKIKEVGLFVGVNQDSLGFYEKIGFKKKFTNWIKNLDNLG